MTRARDLASLGDNTSKLEQQGLVKIIPSSVAVGSGTGSANATGTVTFSGASTVSLNNVFTTDYDNYKIVIKYGGSAIDTSLTLRLRTSAPADVTTNYDSGIDISGPGSGAWSATAATTSFIIGTVGANNTAADLTLYSPAVTEATRCISLATGDKAGIAPYNAQIGSGYNTNTTAYPSFTLLPLTGNITGTVSVYGYTI
jgi:hypothetical protein